jgi:glycerophosphoryl diester phosphodiesterase
MHRSSRLVPAVLSATILLALAGCVSAGPGVEAASSRPLRVAHRGGAGLAPENTLAAFRAGLANGADALELDVHLSADGQLVVIHDPSVDRTTDGSGLVADMTMATLEELDAAARFRGPPSGRQSVPRLEEVLELVAGRPGPGLQVEIKRREDGSRYPGIEERLLSALESYDMVARTVVLSFDFPTLAELRGLEPRLRTCALVGADFFKAAAGASAHRIAGTISALGVEYVGVRERNLTPALFRALREAGLSVGAWTVDDERRMRELSALGAAFITTNRPDLLLRAVP